MRTCTPSPFDPPKMAPKMRTCTPKMAHKILGQPARSPVTTPTSPPTLLAENKSASNLGVDSQPSNERKRLWLPAATKLSDGAKRRKEYLDRYRFGFDNGCRCKCACSLVAMQMIYLLPRLTVAAFTLSPFYTVCGDGEVDTPSPLRMIDFGLPVPSDSNRLVYNSEDNV